VILLFTIAEHVRVYLVIRILYLSLGVRVYLVIRILYLSLGRRGVVTQVSILSLNIIQISHTLYRISLGFQIKKLY
jgi:hypothetical protein